MRFIPPHEVRGLIARAFSAMYGAELPEYNRFVEPVRRSNLQELAKHPELQVRTEAIIEEKHGAIRVPGVMEMRIVTRIFAQMGMEPVEFYDMTILGEKSLPMIATAFRPVDQTIETNAFRMFCSMLHPASIPVSLRADVMAELENNRQIFPKFSDKLVELLDESEEKGGLSDGNLNLFVREVVEAFSMHRDKVVNFQLYSKLRTISDPLADIVLESPVLNHLTPRALNIRDAVHKLVNCGIPMQTVIQGPPIREDGVSVQLNQIARIAAGEEVFASSDQKVLEAFENDPGSLSMLKAAAPKIELQKDEDVSTYMARITDALATNKIVVIQHKARFGEIESRGVALTEEGEIAYNSYQIESETNPGVKKDKIAKFKKDFPKTHGDLHAAGWAYYTYRITDEGRRAADSLDKSVSPDIANLLHAGHVSLIPQTYNDFLPFSAAAIFTANLTTGTEGISRNAANTSTENRTTLEEAMGKRIISRHELHKRDTALSLQQIYQGLGFLRGKFGNQMNFYEHLT